jgi:predicted CXXCH cytochrome family protein
MCDIINIGVTKTRIFFATICKLILLLSICIVTMILSFSESANAKVTGACSDCHTMHNSQNSSSMNLGKTYGIAWGSGECLDCHAATRAVLLRMDCLGCHAENTGGSVNIDPNNNMPQVAHANTTDLAGGNYSYVINIDDSCGHNVHGFGAAIPVDNILGNTPPGYNRSYDPSSGGYQDNDAGQIMCAGQNGCHGNRDEVSQILAIRGTHHENDTILKFGAGFTETGQGNTAGTSYRFLYKVHGAEDNDWQASLSPTDHNEYKGDAFASRSQQNYTLGDPDCVTTISDFCAECHGNFHISGSSGIGSSSSWLRHPTDVLIPTYGEYASLSTTYDVLTPVARQSIADGTTQASGTVTTGTDIVMCLSCHRAHASQFSDSLRWNYSNMSAGTGCFVCHTQKDD